MALHSFATKRRASRSVPVAHSSKCARTSSNTAAASLAHSVPATTRRSVPISLPSAVANSDGPFAPSASSISPSPSSSSFPALDPFPALDALSVKTLEHQIVGNRDEWCANRSRMIPTVLACSSLACVARSATVLSNSASKPRRLDSGRKGSSAADKSGATSAKSRTLSVASARCFAVMDRNPAVRIAPAPSTSWLVRLLNTLSSSAVLCTAVGASEGKRAAAAT